MRVRVRARARVRAGERAREVEVVREVGRVVRVVRERGEWDELGERGSGVAAEGSPVRARQRTDGQTD